MKGRQARIDYSKLESEQSVKRWFTFGGMEPGTKKSYIWHLRDFLVRYVVPKLGLPDSADAFLKWARSEEDLDNVLLAVVDFGENYNPLYSQQKVINILRSFLYWNKLELPPKRQRTHIKSWHRGYKRSEIQTLLGFLDDRKQKLYVLAAKDSGLRMSTLLSVQYRHLLGDLSSAKDGFCAIRFEPKFYESSKSASMTFLGPETIQLLKEIQTWDRETESLQPIYRDGRWTVDPDRKVFDLDASTITESLDIAKKKAGIDPEVQPSHGLRKYHYNSLLRLDGLSQQRLDQLTGHSSGVGWHYNERDVEEGPPEGALRQWYKKAYPFLDLSEKGAVDQRFQEQQREIEQLKQKLREREHQLEDLGFKVQMLIQNPFEIGARRLAKKLRQKKD